MPLGRVRAVTDLQKECKNNNKDKFQTYFLFWILVFFFFSYHFIYYILSTKITSIVEYRAHKCRSVVYIVVGDVLARDRRRPPHLGHTPRKGRTYCPGLFTVCLLYLPFCLSFTLVLFMVIWVGHLVSNHRVNFQVGERRIYIYIYIYSPLMLNHPPQQSSYLQPTHHRKLAPTMTVDMEKCKRIVQYFWDPEPRNDVPAASIWCLGREYAPQPSSDQTSESRPSEYITPYPTSNTPYSQQPT